MLCEKCKKNQATVFYKETVNGKTKSYSVCQDCAQELQNNGEMNLDAGSFWNDPLGDWFGGSLWSNLFAPLGLQSGVKARNEKRCNLCGATLEELLEEGKVGCPRCYETFEDELENSIRRIHGTGRHTGRLPGRKRAAYDRQRQIDELEKKLQQAVKEEKYEEAAKLRDEIKGLKDSAADESAAS